MHQLQCGSQQLPIDLPGERLVGAFRGPVAPPDEDVTGQVRTQLANPIDSPPLRRTVVPGDRVSVVLDGGLPHSERWVVPILECLHGAQVSLNDIGVICTPETEETDLAPLRAALTGDLSSVSVTVHDPEDQLTHAYLASTQNGWRVYVNRAVVEADAVIVVGRAGFDPVVGLRGTCADLFPTLSNAEAQKHSRLLAMSERDDPATLRDRQRCDEVGWLTGLFFAVAVILDRNGDVVGTWPGQATSVHQATSSEVAQSWTIVPPDPAPDLVIASLCPSGKPCDWPRVGAALETATRLADPAGKILVVCDLDTPPGPTGRWLVDNDNVWDVLTRLRESSSSDALTTAQCATAIASNRVHLFSRLDPELVESMSMVAVSSPREIENLIAHCDSVFLIEDADRAHVARR